MRDISGCLEHGYFGNCPVCQIAEKDSHIKELKEGIEAAIKSYENPVLETGCHIKILRNLLEGKK